MGILTVVCYEQAGLFEYFSAPGSQAGCSFMKALYCISFLCQGPFPVAVLCQTTMTLCFLQVAWRQVCHEPWGLTAGHRTTSLPPPQFSLSVSLFSSNSPPCPLWTLLFLCKRMFPLMLTYVFRHLFLHLYLLHLLLFSYPPPPVCLSPSSPSCFPLSTPPFLFASLLPSSLCPAVQVRRGSVRRFLCKPRYQTTPCEGISAAAVCDAL